MDLKCPVCKSTKMASILYGYPAFSLELEVALEEKRVVLGGCFIVTDDPNWQCTACDTEFFQKNDFDISLLDN